MYTRVPRCAYKVGVYAIERDGTFTAPESADLAPLHMLAQEGLLEGWDGGAERAYNQPPACLPPANSLRNLITVIYARGSLISKTTGGNFHCTRALVSSLKKCLTTADMLAHHARPRRTDFCR